MPKIYGFRLRILAIMRKARRKKKLVFVPVINNRLACVVEDGRYLAVRSCFGTEDQKSIENTTFSMLFSYPVTQFFVDCYTICYAADRQLPTNELLVTHRKTDRQLSCSTALT